MSALRARRQINPELREKPHTVCGDFRRFLIEDQIAVRGKKVGQIDTEATGKVVVANPCVLKLLGLTRQRAVSRTVFEGDGHNPVDHLGDLRRRETEIAVSAIGYRREQSCLREFRQVRARGLGSDARGIGEFGRRQRTAIEQC